MKFVPNSISRNIGRKILTTKKNSPHIFFAAGVVGVVGSTVLACRATLQLEEHLDEIKHDLEQVNSKNAGPRADDDPYSDEDRFRDLGYVYGKAVSKIGRLYGPSVVLGAVSIGALTGSHIQMSRRNTALTATVAAISKAYDDYRLRVQDELGEEKELDIYHAARDETANVDGKKQTVKVADPNGWSPYARFFDEASSQWQKDSELNRIFVQCQQNYANHLLQARGHLFLNEVYDMLGLERSQAGQVVGWVTNGDGDGFVDFGLFEATSSRFINNLERSILLDFNVDGVVYDKI